MSQGHYEDSKREEAEFYSYLERGFKEIYGNYIPNEKIDAFIARLGKLNEETLVRVLTGDQGEERLLSLCVMGESDFPEKKKALELFLHSPDPKERWLSAMYLGRIKAESAFPYLVTMLTEFFPTAQSSVIVDEQEWFEQHRTAAVQNLLLWEETSIIPILRRSFITCVQAEQYLPDTKYKRFQLQSWYRYQDALARTFGRLEAFGILTGIPLLPDHLRISVVNIALGYCRVEDRRQEFGIAFDWQEHEGFRKEVTKVIEQRFGLFEEEQNHYLELYRQDYYSLIPARDLLRK